MALKMEETFPKDIHSNDLFLILRTNSMTCASELKIQTQNTRSSVFLLSRRRSWLESTSVDSTCPHCLSFFSHRRFLFSGKPILCILHEADSCHIGKNGKNLCPGPGSHMKMKPAIKVNMRPKQVNLIHHHDFSAFKEEDYFSLFCLLS